MQLSMINAADQTATLSARPQRIVRPNSLYLMIKPPLTLSETLWHFPEASSSRPPELFHVTIQPVGDRSSLRDADIASFCAILDGFCHAPFWTGFDRVEAGHSSSLRGDTNARLRDFHLAVTETLRAHFPWLPAYRMRPHLTLNYHASGRGRMLAEPVGWMVEEFMLVESVYGETRHMEWGRWRLREPSPA